jgi:ferredoxin
MKRSTRAFMQEGRKLEKYSFFDFLHGYIYARFPYLYIGLALGEHPLAEVYLRLRAMQKHLAFLLGIHEKKRGMADTYHGKVLLPDDAHSLVRIEEDIVLRDLEHVIPYPVARDIILKNPGHIVVLECPCRAVREDPCLPLDVCLIVGEPFAGFVLEHHPGRSKPLTREQAIHVLAQERQRGHVHHAFFKDAMLGRFYAICNCCSCCCGAIQSVRSGNPMITSSGYLAYVEEQSCTGCGACLAACNFAALQDASGVTMVREDRCMGCGLCVDACPEGALRLGREASRGLPLEIERLMDDARTRPARPVLNRSILNR